MYLIPITEIKEIKPSSRVYRIKLTCGYSLRSGLISGDDNMVYAAPDESMGCKLKCPHERCVVTEIKEKGDIRKHDNPTDAQGS